MKGSLIVVGFFALGCLLGWSGYLPGVIIENDITVYVLYLLMFQVGISIGSDKKLKDILSSIRPKLLLVPLATIIGTLSFSALISLALTKWSVFDCLAVGSGFAYYSLSSILITELKEPTLGAQLAAELGTIALIANIIREIFALLGAPLFVRYFGRLSPICAGGATTMDTTLPIITRYCGKDLVFVSIFHPRTWPSSIRGRRRWSRFPRTIFPSTGGLRPISSRSAPIRLRTSAASSSTWSRSARTRTPFRTARSSCRSSPAW